MCALLIVACLSNIPFSFTYNLLALNRNWNFTEALLVSCVNVATSMFSHGLTLHHQRSTWDWIFKYMLYFQVINKYKWCTSIRFLPLFICHMHRYYDVKPISDRLCSCVWYGTFPQDRYIDPRNFISGIF